MSISTIMAPRLYRLVNIFTALLCLSLVSDGWALRPTPFRSQNALARKRLGHSLRRQASSGEGKGQAQCENVAPEATTSKNNIWNPLTDDETAGVVAWLFQQRELDLTPTSIPLTVGNSTGPSFNGTSSSPLPFNGNFSGPAPNGSFPGFRNFAWLNTISNVELMYPNKSDALSYLDGNGTEPKRYAHVVLSNSATEDAHFANILVGPLPINNATAKWSHLDYPFNGGGGGKVRQLDPDMGARYSRLVGPACTNISDIVKDLWGASCGGGFGPPGFGPPRNGTSRNATRHVTAFSVDPLDQDDGRVKAWYMFYEMPAGIFDTHTLNPLGLYFRADITGRDPAKWGIEGWFYNNIFYNTTEEFRKAYWSAGFEKVRGGDIGHVGATDRQGDPLPLDDTPPPASAASSKPRFAVNVKQRYVQWMDFSFFLGFGQDMGISLFDIRYKGERILYELSLQEALAHYAGNDPLMSGIAYLDSFYGFGASAFELIPGFDCPQYATYLNSSHYATETTYTHLRSICLFESDADYPIQRHTSHDYVSITKNTQFTLRHVSTVGNYDYTVSYTFSLDGTIETIIRASGYISSAFAAHNEDYGFRIADTVNGAMHDHVINLKADFDVFGTANSAQLVSNVPVSKTYPWSGGKVRNTMQLKRQFIDNEDNSRFDWDRLPGGGGGNSAAQLLILNKEARNRHGEHRAWRVQPSTPPVHLTVLNSSSLARSARWAETDVSISRVKADGAAEARSANPYNNQDVHDPPVDFGRFFDGESLDQQDLVVWVNLGMHHVPHSGDLPNTVMTAAQAGVKFVPTNYFDYDPSRRSKSQVRVDFGQGARGDKSTVKAQGRAPVCESDLGAYKGEVGVSKYPYDPNHPFFGFGGF